jgi:23S rRNA (guanosine2251-2'-O)-methyltransferase
LAQKESDTFNSSLYKLHIIVDKSGKAPAQLKTAVDQAQFLGIKIFTHASAEEDWPLSGNQELNHQRICLTIPEYPTKNVVDAVNTVKQAAEKSEHGCVGIVLDQIQDPRNFGAILRSAAYFGVKFVVFGTDRQASITSLVLKTSAGGAFSIDLIPVTNINRAIEQLKEAGCWVIGTSLEEGKTSPLSKLPKDRTWVAVMGNEEKGLRSEVAKNCDYLVKIEGKPQGVDSLNVSVATGIFLHSLAQ